MVLFVQQSPVRIIEKGYVHEPEVSEHTAIAKADARIARLHGINKVKLKQRI
jgi:hypothetical protein